MQQASKSSKQRKQPGRAPVQRAGVTELTEQELGRVQGGVSQNGGILPTALGTGSGGGAGKVGQV